MQEKERTDEILENTPNEESMIPVVALRGLVAFPHMVIDFEVGRAESRKAVDAALERDRRILLIAQRDQAILEPKPRDLYRVGVICEVRQVMRGRRHCRIGSGKRCAN